MARATVTFCPWATVILEMPRVNVVAFTLVSVPIVAPVTVMSVAARDVGSASKVRVNCDVVVVALPLAVRLVQSMAVGVAAPVGGKVTSNTSVVPLLLTQAGAMPFTVKPAICAVFAKPPVNVKPLAAVSVIVAVYAVLWLNVVGLPFHARTEVKPVPLSMAVLGLAVATGDVTPVIGAAVMRVGIRRKPTST